MFVFTLIAKTIKHSTVDGMHSWPTELLGKIRTKLKLVCVDVCTVGDGTYKGTKDATCERRSVTCRPRQLFELLCLP